MLGPLALGALGGGAIFVVALVVLAVTGGVGSSTKVVTVQEAPIVSATASRRAQPVTAHEIYERDAPGVVFVSATGNGDGQSPSEFLRGEGGGQGTSTGSGFEIDGDGRILTNWHVVENAVKVTVSVEHGKTVEARVIGEDPSSDLALLHIPTDGIVPQPLTLGESRKALVGDPVLAIGNPFGLGRTLTTGVVSAVERQIQAPNGVKINNVLQTDAPINPGNSGGPLLNAAGEVIGINSQILTSGDRSGNIGIAFAIPIDTAKQDLSKLEGRH